ncbi:putative polyglutamine synthesis accessory protein [Streptomyces humidus]|uniref:Polyglutamine synthesis accessory protein n=1 Tax=Streptomyces humidus TaxID=52259 RepID=A0A918FZX3_9ACTN|nr:CapA family protein [Streptomyces humidus]GGS02868.1 putative polyglutamine synthesis accessory protein [Streptomyces humidus]
MGVVTLFLGGDVMLGRGVDQILPHPGDPALRETYLHDARDYVGLAEAANGPIPRPVDFRWPWGEALPVLDNAAPDVRVVNLETAVTGDGDFAPDKGIHYRMSPANLPCLAAARPDVCVLANNHVLDFGPRGLCETLDALAEAGLRTAGAGRDAVRARQPAIVPLDAGGRVLVFSFGMPSSGIPEDWAATGQQAGVDVISELSVAAASALADRLRQVRRPGDIAVASVHWGPNWGYDVSRSEVRFAHALVDGGVDIVHGHSSHHPRPLEVYQDRLILYGCGDLVDDYEGIGGYESYRDDLRMLYLVSVEAVTGRLVDARMAPLQARRMRLEHASPEDTEWLRAVLDRHSREFGTRIDGGPDGALTLRPLRMGRRT